MKRIIYILLLFMFNIAYAQTDTEMASDSTPQVAEAQTQTAIPVEPEKVDLQGKIPVLNTIIVDGQAGDWQDVPIFIEDVAADVRTKYVGEDVCEFDVKDIKFAFNNTYLLILVELADELNYYFSTNRARAKVIGTLFLDTDNDKNTGGVEFFSKIGGFESRIDIWSGVKIKNNGRSVSGNTYLSGVTKDTKLEYFLEYIPSKYDQTGEFINIDFSKKVRSDEQSQLINYAGKFIEFKVPCADLHIRVEKNRKIRVIFSEAGSGAWGCGQDTFSEEARGTIYYLDQ